MYGRFGGLESLDYPNKTEFALNWKARGLAGDHVGEMLTATAMGHFDAQSKAVVLALFVPLIISSGSNRLDHRQLHLDHTRHGAERTTIKDWWYVMRH